MNDVTFLIAVKFESADRRENFDIVMQYLKAHNCNILVHETTDTPFHRTKYLNMLIKKATTPIVALWDADIIAPWGHITEAYNHILTGCTLAYPFTGVMLDIPKHLKTAAVETWIPYKHQFKNLSLASNSVGGGVLVHKDRYIQCGMENENFIGWGCEDLERFFRVQALGHIIHKIAGPIYHLTHERLVGNGFDNPNIQHNTTEMNKVRAMSTKELRAYIKTWEWTK